jgi:branched-chain amino acid transport system permease protein
MIWINQIVQGVLLGGYYALIACGLSFMFSVMGVINIAHGSLAVLAAFGLFVLADRFGVSPFLGLIFVVPAMAAVGWALQRAVLERSARAGLLVPILSTFGLSIVIDNLLFEQFGADTRSLAPYIGSFSYDSWSLSDDIDIGQLSVLIFATAIVLLGGLQLFLSRTALGRAIRATAEDPDTVGLVGVDARFVNAVAAAIAMATVALAGRFGHARDLRSLRRRATIDFRFRSGGDRWRRFALGHLVWRHHLGRRAKHRRANQSAGFFHRWPRGLSRCPVWPVVLG